MPQLTIEDLRQLPTSAVDREEDMHQVAAFQELEVVQWQKSTQRRIATRMGWRENLWLNIIEILMPQLTIEDLRPLPTPAVDREEVIHQAATSQELDECPPGGQILTPQWHSYP